MNWIWQTGTLVQVGTLLVGAVAIWVALLNQRRQLNAQMFIEFSARFQELLRLFPTDAWLANLNSARPMPPRSQDVRDCTLYCIQLIADVYHLHHAGYITKHLWMLWEREIRHTLSGPVFQREWEDISAEFVSNPDFFHYISILINSRRQTTIPASSLPSGRRAPTKRATMGSSWIAKSLARRWRSRR
jgi:hypothetical protein